MLELLIIFGALAGLGLVLLSSAAIAGWRRERRRSRLLAEQLLAEGHIERLTLQTLQAMRQVVRDQLRTER